MRKNIELLDCTLRDGSYAIDFRFTSSQTSVLCRALEEAGFRYVEVGHGFGLGAAAAGRGPAAESDWEYLRAAREALVKARFGCFFIPAVGRMEHLDMARDMGMNFVRIGTNATEVAQAEPYVDHARALGLEVMFFFMKSYALPMADLVKEARMPSAWGCSVLFLADSAGCMLPREVGEYVRALKSETGASVGFHGHNNLQLAVANSVAAIEAGADLCDCTLRGMGRSAGNTQTEVLLGVLHKMGYPLRHDFFKVMRAAECIVQPLMKSTQGVNSLEIVTGLSRFHTHFLPWMEEAVRRYPMIDLYRLIMNVCSRNCVNPGMDLILEEAHRLADESMDRRQEAANA